MDRKLLVELFQNGMKYTPGKHRFWVSRCFEINVRHDHVVELDEYEGFGSEQHPDEKRLAPLVVPAKSPKKKKMFHVGRSVLNLRDGQVVEEPGNGWEKNG